VDFKRDLSGGDLRSIGRANAAAAYVLQHREALRELIAAMRDSDAVVRMRAADAAEKVSVREPAWFSPHANTLLSLAETSTQQEVRWHLAQMLPRLALSPAKRKRAAAALLNYLEDKSKIVQVTAMTALAELANDDEAKQRVMNILNKAARSKHASLRARAKKLKAGMAE
jgi:hypothetical protein